MAQRPYEIQQTELTFPISEDFDINDTNLRTALIAGVHQAMRMLIEIVRPDAEVVFIRLSYLGDRHSTSYENMPEGGSPPKRYLQVKVDYALI